MPVSKHLTKFTWRRSPKSEQFVPGNQVALVTNGPEALEQMLAAVAGAEHSVWLEMYWFAADGIGQRFFAQLGNAAERGVYVAVNYDAWGSWGTPRRHFDELVRRGVRVSCYNPVSPFERHFKLATLTRRNHRKLLIVDGKVAFTGGINIADEWIGNARFPPWKDELLTVSGPVVKDLLATFLTSWNQEGVALLSAARAAPADALNQQPVGDMRVAVLTQSGFRQRRHAMSAYVRRMRGARERIYIANAYFIPNRTVVRELRAAALRGVQVEIIVAGRSDVPIVTLASRAVWAKLLRAGVKLYEWHESVLHSKLAIVDGTWVTAGSFNLDYVSLRNNRELNLSVENEAFAQRAESEFRSWIPLCKHVDYDAFRKRPLWLRLCERFLHLFRTWL